MKQFLFTIVFVFQVVHQVQAYSFKEESYDYTIKNKVHSIQVESAVVSNLEQTTWTNLGNGVWNLGNSGQRATISGSDIIISGQGAMSNLTYRDSCAFAAIIFNPRRIIIEEGITDIGSYFFSGCDAVVSIIIPQSVTSIHAYAFAGCSNLASVIIHGDISRLHFRAFHNSGSFTASVMEEVTDLTEILHCSNIVNFEVSEGNPVYSSLDGTLYNKDYSHIFRHPKNRSGSFTIPNTVTHIGQNAFDGCSLLPSLTLSNSITHIGDCAFTQ